ncbi:class I SAM-dependent methyltransferase [Nocardia crassostreae]|uniref:class I SAM-dependent methyltransferase n=1 Tax=Nocardia crassostreae TaxID=53428 RepID=UPI000836ADDA|nr:class I SAM-dependent methyltransferase [Nocardia crassostreae]
MTTATGETRCEGSEPPPAAGHRPHRRLLAAARTRYAEDRLADAVCTGTRQVVLIGAALDTFAAHNPYPDLRVFRIGGAEFEMVTAAPDFERASPAFVIGLGPRRECAEALAILRGAGRLAAGTEIVFDYPPGAASVVAQFLRDTGFAVLKDLGPQALASRYLDLEVGAVHSAEPRVARARVRNNAGRPPSSLSVG